jgi:hypothetical protein
MNTKLPAKVRERLAAERLREFDVPARICNSASVGTYRTGMGETPVAVRPGAMRAFELPSKGMKV